MTSSSSSDRAAPKLPLLSDQATTVDAEDDFGHSDYVELLADVVREAPHGAPWTVALFGPWGVGKTKILQSLGKRLGDSCAFVIFDAWRYERDSLRREFLLAVARDLRSQGLLDRGYDPDDRLREVRVELRRREQRLRFSVAALAQAAVVGLVTGLALFFILKIHVVHEALGGRSPDHAGAIGLATALLVTLITAVNNILELTPEVNVVRPLEDPGRFAELFAELVRAVRTSRLAIAIDNLDRCTPEHAIELLTTIKTFLEPAAQAAQVAESVATDTLFLVAVDDEALRRHLLARELEQSPGGEQGPQLTIAERSVDEYLRKFFAATCRIPPFLQSDITEFAERHLEGFRHQPGLDATKFKRLVELVARGLRQNPRRIKQFINNLELRQALLRLRENPRRRGGAAITERISDDVVGLAKLAILEEEWPRHYQVLQNAPQRFEQWHEAAFDGSDPHESDADQSLKDEWVTLADFLRSSLDVRPRRIRQFLRYKMSNQERALPAYDDFREGAISGARDEVQQILTESEDDADGYAAEMPKIFAEEMRAGYVQAARSLLEVALTVPGLAQREPIRALLSDAADYPQFASELVRLPVQPLFDALESLDAQSRREILSRIVPRIGQADTPTLRRDICRALAQQLKVLSDADKAQLRNTMESEPLVQQPDALLPLITADENLLSQPLSDHLVMQLQRNPGAMAVDPATVDLLGLMLRRRSESYLHDRVLAFIPSAVGTFLPEQAFDHRAFNRLKRLVDGCVHATQQQWQQAAQQLSGTLGSVPLSSRPAVASLIHKVALKGWGQQQNPAMSQAFDVMLSDIPSGIAWIRQEFGGSLSELAEVILPRLVQVASSDPDLREPTIDFIREIVPDAWELAVGQVITSRIAAGDTVGAGELMKGADWSQRAAEPIINAIIARYHDAGRQEQLADLELLVPLREHIGPLQPAVEQYLSELASNPAPAEVPKIAQLVEQLGGSIIQSDPIVTHAEAIAAAAMSGALDRERLVALAIVAERPIDQALIDRILRYLVERWQNRPDLRIEVERVTNGLGHGLRRSIAMLLVAQAPSADDPTLRSEIPRWAKELDPNDEKRRSSVSDTRTHLEG